MGRTERAKLKARTKTHAHTPTHQRRLEITPGKVWEKASAVQLQTRASTGSIIAAI